MPRSYIHVGQVKNAAGTRHAMPRVTNALSQVNRFHKDMLLNRETEQQKRRMSQVSRSHLSISTRSSINEWTKTLATQLKALKSRYPVLHFKTMNKYSVWWATGIRLVG